ncbi:SAM-dependent methyltransferase [Mucisphaera calidilacus]|uniref:SAM-dependent methyltransferase n=1 Tax=Mucisphaera calidilacus TaxID=2527982 RepID=UPI0011A101AD|nr:class I SAM-dependent methyltransferase [Mucisphaera calidilacus]
MSIPPPPPPRSSNKDKKGTSKKGSKGPTKAERADRYALYLKAVQDPDHEVEFFEQAYREANGSAEPLVLREDFCGTFAVCCKWVAGKAGRRSLGVDLDAEPLAWGKKHHLEKLTVEQQKRVTLVQDDVRKVCSPKADVLAAQNFSFYLFMERKELLAYFKAARRNLAPGGVMVLDMMGGPDCLLEDQNEPRKCDGFTYVWRTETVNPITNISEHSIGFKFKDGSKLERAFSYRWRLWSIPEVRDLLEEAGFARVDVYWEGEGDEGEGDGNWKITTEAAMDPSWLCYVVARRDHEAVTTVDHEGKA